MSNYGKASLKTKQGTDGGGEKLKQQRILELDCPTFNSKAFSWAALEKLLRFSSVFCFQIWEMDPVSFFQWLTGRIKEEQN